ncbi:unnamed protein product, partial [Ectocarpus fasciculatus]
LSENNPSSAPSPTIRAPYLQKGCGRPKWQHRARRRSTKPGGNPRLNEHSTTSLRSKLLAWSASWSFIPYSGGGFVPMRNRMTKPPLESLGRGNVSPALFKAERRCGARSGPHSSSASCGSKTCSSSSRSKL